MVFHYHSFADPNFLAIVAEVHNDVAARCNADER